MNQLIKICLSAIIFLAAVLPYMNAADAAGSLDSIFSTGITVTVILFVIFLAAIRSYCKALQRCLTLIAPGNRKASPASVWYMFLIPYNFIEDFFIMINVSRSLEEEVKGNPRLSGITQYGLSSGLGWCIAQVLSLMPGHPGQIAGALAIILWIIHWRFINRINHLLSAKVASGSDQ